MCQGLVVSNRRVAAQLSLKVEAAALGRRTCARCGRTVACTDWMYSTAFFILSVVYLSTLSREARQKSCAQ